MRLSTRQALSSGLATADWMEHLGKRASGVSERSVGGAGASTARGVSNALAPRPVLLRGALTNGLLQQRGVRGPGMQLTAGLPAAMLTPSSHPPLHPLSSHRHRSITCTLARTHIFIILFALPSAVCQSLCEVRGH